MFRDRRSVEQSTGDVRVQECGSPAPLGSIPSEVDVGIAPRPDIVRRVGGERGPLIERTIDAGRGRDESEISEHPSAWVLSEGDDARTEAERMDRRETHTERLSTRGGKVAEDGQVGRAARYELDRRERERDIPGRRRDLGEHVRAVGQLQEGRRLGRGGPCDLDMDRIQSYRLAVRRQREPERGRTVTRDG